MRHEQPSQEAGRRHPNEPQRVRPRGVASAAPCGQEFTEVRVDERKLRADADAGEKARHDQHRRVDAGRAEQREPGVDAQVQQERRSPSVPIGEPAKKRRAEEHADKARAEDRGQRQPAQMKLLRQHGPEHTSKKDIEEIEKRSDASDDRRRPVRPGRRQPVQPGSDGNGRTHLGG